MKSVAVIVSGMMLLASCGSKADSESEQAVPNAQAGAPAQVIPKEVTNLLVSRVKQPVITEGNPTTYKNFVRIEFDLQYPWPIKGFEVKRGTERAFFALMTSVEEKGPALRHVRLDGSTMYEDVASAWGPNATIDVFVTLDEKMTFRELHETYKNRLQQFVSEGREDVVVQAENSKPLKVYLERISTEPEVKWKIGAQSEALSNCGYSLVFLIRSSESEIFSYTYGPEDYDEGAMFILIDWPGASHSFPCGEHYKYAYTHVTLPAGQTGPAKFGAYCVKIPALKIRHVAVK